MIKLTWKGECFSLWLGCVLYCNANIIMGKRSAGQKQNAEMSIWGWIGSSGRPFSNRRKQMAFFKNASAQGIEKEKYKCWFDNIQIEQEAGCCSWCLLAINSFHTPRDFYDYGRPYISYFQFYFIFGFSFLPKCHKPRLGTRGQQSCDKISYQQKKFVFLFVPSRRNPVYNNNSPTRNFIIPSTVCWFCCAGLFF